MPNLRRASARTPLLLSIAGLLLVPGSVLAQSPSAATGAGSGASPAPCVPGEVGTIDHPTGCTDVVLRLDSCCGFMMVEANLVSAPVFTLYGNNHAIFRPQPADGMYPGPGQPMTPFVEAVLTPAQVDALLTYALGPGGLAAAPEQLLNPMIADAPTTIFTIDAGGVQKQVSAQALSPDNDPSTPDAQVRDQLASLSDLLDSFEDQVAAGNVESAAPYEPTAYRGALTQVYDGATDPVVAWPWPDLPPSAFVGPADGVARYATLTPEQVAAVTPVPSGGITSVRLKAEDGTEAYLSVRPLLPGEPALPDGIA
ncbi:MAG: hypothetical protein U0869_10340 [Chloroflexota bacterium]